MGGGPTADALIESATTATGLSDFGEGAWEDGLRVLCDALGAEAQLNDLGRAMFEAQLGNLLRQRLGVVDWRSRHPEIADERIDRPVVVVGLPRTGTTALAHLLAADPGSRSLRTWEAGSPTPPPEAATYATDPRIAATQAGIDISHQLMPELPRLYFATATSPSETLDLLGMSFRAFQVEGQAHIPSYEEWILGTDMTDAYAFERGVLQLLQWRCPPTRWQWKNPPDVMWLDTLRAVFPDAVLVWTHREPAAILASLCSLVTVVRQVGTDHMDRRELGPRQLVLWGEAIDRGMAARDAIGEGAFVDVWMSDLDADPIGTVRTLYERLGWELSSDAEGAMGEWVAANRRGGRGRHEPDLSDFGLDAAAVRSRFADYRDRFGKEGW